MNMLNNEIGQEVLALKPIISPAGQALNLSLFEGIEGLSVNTDCSIFETRLRWSELAAHFECEANSNEIPEELKHQRDVSNNDPRIKNLRTYVTSRADTVFPSIIIFVNRIDIKNAVKLGNGDTIFEAVLEANAHRLICDGQGRTTTIKSVLSNHPEWNGNTIGVKFISTNTDSLYEASDVIRQVFCDINGSTQKPDSSLSMYFDISKPFPRLIKEILEAELDIEGRRIQLRQLVALNGDIKLGQLWTLKQFSDSFPVLFGATASSLNKSLSEKSQYDSTKAIGVEFYRRILAQLPLNELFTSDKNEFKQLHKVSMFTKALFSKALGYVGRSLYEEAIAADGDIDWSKLDGLKKLPLLTLDSSVWINSQICWNDESLKKPVVKIYKSSDKKIARVICQYCRIFPTMDI